MNHRLLFDVTGLIHWYAYFRHPTGIQRVTEKILGSSPICDYPHLEFVARILGSDSFYRVDPHILLQLDKLDGRDAAISRLRAIFAQSMRLTTMLGLRRDLRYFHWPYLAAGFAHLEGLVEARVGAKYATVLSPLELIAPPTETDAFLSPGDY